MMPTPCDFSSPMTRKSRSTSLSLSEAVGSSMIKMRASAPRARAISTSCCSGIDSERTSVSGSIVAPIFSSKSRARVRRSAPADTAPASVRLEPDRDVLGDRQVRKERRLLVNRGDSQLARTHRIEVADRLALDLDCSLVGQMGAGDHLDQRRFARAVFADQGVDLAGPQVERNPLQGLHAGKRLADSVNSEQRCDHVARSPLAVALDLPALVASTARRVRTP